MGAPWWKQRPAALVATTTMAIALVASACGSEPVEPLGLTAPATESSRPSAESDVPESSDTAPTSPRSGPSSPPSNNPAPASTADAPSPSPSPSPTSVERPPAPNGRVAPTVADSPVGLAAQLTEAERGLADPDATLVELADWGHLHQVAIRKLGYEPDWDTEVFEALPPDLVERTLLHVSARRALIDLHSGYEAADFIPAWEIVGPEAEAALLSYYREAEQGTGIEWEYLAAINLIETGMGRIRGLSSAGAQGPMQFLPTTWAEAGIGEGDINDPADAIAAAARYLVRRGGPEDMDDAVWGYNNSDNYVTAVQAYAAALRADPAAYRAIYHWEIYFFTEAGDIWLPTGFRTDESIDLDDFLAAHPWSAPDPGLQ